MRCLVCYADVPEGKTTCPYCAATLVPKEPGKQKENMIKIGWHPDGTPIWGFRHNWSGWYRASEKPLRRIYVCEWFQLAMTVVSFVIVVWMMLGLIISEGNDFDFTNTIEAFSEKILTYLLVILLPAAVAWLIVLGLSYHEMRYLEPEFDRVLYGVAAWIVTAGLKNAFDASNSQIVIFTALAAIGLAVYHVLLYRALSYYTQSIFPELSKRWEKLTTYYLVMLIIETILEIFRKVDLNNVSFAYGLNVHLQGGLLIICALIEMLLIIVEWIFLRKTYRVCRSVTRGTGRS